MGINSIQTAPHTLATKARDIIMSAFTLSRAALIAFVQSPIPRCAPPVCHLKGVPEHMHRRPRYSLWERLLGRVHFPRGGTHGPDNYSPHFHTAYNPVGSRLVHFSSEHSFVCDTHPYVVMSYICSSGSRRREGYMLVRAFQNSSHSLGLGWSTRVTYSVN